MQIAFLKLLLELASLTAKYLHDKQLIDAGYAKAIMDNLNEADNQIRLAKRAMDDANSVPVSEDKYNRDK